MIEQASRYGVLDFDGTCINGDISHAFAYTRAYHLDFDVSPAHFEEILYNLTAGDEIFYFEFLQAFKNIKFYGKKGSHFLMWLNSFATFYKSLYQKYEKDLVWLFLHQLNAREIKEYIPKVWRSKEIYEESPNKEMFFPLSIFEPINELIEIAKKRKYKTYLVSASPQILVEALANYEEVGFHLSESDIFGIELQKDDDKYTYEVDKSKIFTLGQGKYECIEQLIAPNHKGQEPFFVAGDGSGDLEMLENFSSTSLRIYIDRKRKGRISDKILDLKKEILKEYSYDDLSFLDKGCFLKCKTRVLLSNCCIDLQSWQKFLKKEL